MVIADLVDKTLETGSTELLEVGDNLAGQTLQFLLARSLPLRPAAQPGNSGLRANLRCDLIVLSLVQ